MENKKLLPPSLLHRSLPLGGRRATTGNEIQDVRGRNAEELTATEQKASALPTRASGFGTSGASDGPGVREQLQVS